MKGEEMEDNELTKAEKNKLRPDWEKECGNCQETPVVPMSGLCGPCHFGEADTSLGDWWDDKKDCLK